MGELNNVCKQKKNEQNWSEGGEEWSVFDFVWGNCASFRGLFCNIMFFLILSMEPFFLKIVFPKHDFKMPVICTNLCIKSPII